MKMSPVIRILLPALSAVLSALCIALTVLLMKTSA